MRLVIFDCDGVLVDSERISVRIGTSVLADLGWRLTEREFAERFVGCSPEHFHREVERGLGRRLPAGWEAQFEARYLEAFEAELTPVPGVVDLLDDLEQAGVPVCVASNSGHAHVRHVLGVTGLLPRFADDRRFSAEDVAAGKPAPDLFLTAARRMGAEPAATVVVEDSPFGVTAARAAGMRCLALVGGTTPADRLTGLGATLVGSMAEAGRLLVPASTPGVAASGPGSAEGVDMAVNAENALSPVVENLLNTSQDITSRSGMQATEATASASAADAEGRVPA